MRNNSLNIDDKINIDFKKIILFLFGLYFILKPFYFWGSGLPQLSDFILIFSVILFLTHIKFNIKIEKDSSWILFLPVLFVFWVTIINFIWVLIYQSSDNFVISSIFYIYNGAIYLLTIFLIQKYKTDALRLIYNSVLISLFLQLSLFFFNGGFTGVRATGSFNNPNQLGFYGLLMISLLIILNNKLKVSLKTFLMGISIALFLVLISLSNAAILSALGLIFFSLFKDNRYKKEILMIAFFAIFLIIFLYYFTDLLEQNSLVNSVQQRVRSIGENNDDNLEGRGYNRIFDYPKYWVFGAGEGGFNRFGGFLGGSEMHSTIGNIQVSYGLIGTILFSSFLGYIFIKDKFKNSYVIIFVLIYGLTHNGIRNTLFWIILAIIILDIKALKNTS